MNPLFSFPILYLQAPARAECERKEISSMDDLVRTIIEQKVNQNLQNNRESMLHALTKNITEEMSANEQFSKMIINATDFSVHFSVQIIVELLLSLEVLEPLDDADLRKQLLKPLTETNSSDKE